MQTFNGGIEHPRRHSLITAPPTTVGPFTSVSTEHVAYNTTRLKVFAQKRNYSPGERTIKALRREKVKYDHNTAVVTENENHRAEDAQRAVPQ